MTEQEQTVQQLETMYKGALHTFGALARVIEYERYLYVLALKIAKVHLAGARFQIGRMVE